MILVKVHRVFPSHCTLSAFSPRIQFHRIIIGDREAVVTPFMQDGTYPPRNFATFGPSGLQPPFTGTYAIGHTYYFSSYSTWQASDSIHGY